MKQETMSSNSDNDVGDGGLGNQVLLAKVDKLRELGVGSMIGLPQIIVVGDQSSGKSSVLESLTSFSFPRAPGLCTRYATQITCRRELHISTTISIIPHTGSSAARQEMLRKFHRTINDSEGADFSQIFEEANEVMGIRPDSGGSSGSSENAGLTTFSEDILKIEISGPNEQHLTVIDVPGIFRAATPGLTSESDITLVRDMVKRYMKDSRTIILAVIPCNVDIATQEILKLAKDADPAGIRTMGVLTKPDLLLEHATKQVVIDLVEGKRNDLQLGYCVVKNRSADDTGSSLGARHADERTFFAVDPWRGLAQTGRVGVGALRKRLQELLMDVSRREFPTVKAEISRKLSECRTTLDKLGESRSDSNAQRVFLTKLSSEFQKITGHALSGAYTEDPIFEYQPNMRLITRILALNEAFSNTFAARGHMRRFESRKAGVTDDSGLNLGPQAVDFDIPLERYGELAYIIRTERYDCPSPIEDSIMDHIESVYNSSRGPELGTFGGTLLGTTFKEQTKKWEDLVLSHVSSAIAIVHSFINTLMHTVFPEESVREEVWDSLLVEELQAAYERAMNHARWLLEIEREGQPMTVNHYFSANLDKNKMSRFDQVVAALYPPNDSGFRGQGQQEMVSLSQLRSIRPSNKSNAQQVREEIHDILQSYYQVSRKRFVDVVCQQAVDHFLLNGSRSPLRILSPGRVAELSEDQLEMIAGEDTATRRLRRVTAEEIARLEAAMKVLRG